MSQKVTHFYETDLYLGLSRRLGIFELVSGIGSDFLRAEEIGSILQGKFESFIEHWCLGKSAAVRDHKVVFKKAQ